jgi:hypothetical protein
MVLKKAAQKLTRKHPMAGPRAGGTVLLSSPVTIFLSDDALITDEI